LFRMVLGFFFAGLGFLLVLQPIVNKVQCCLDF
jgi:hypothetical protein